MCPAGSQIVGILAIETVRKSSTILPDLSNITVNVRENTITIQVKVLNYF